jgi:predicted O-methyltransferase YrrM
MTPADGKSRLPAVLKDAFATGTVLTGEGRRMELHSNISIAEAEHLYDVVRKVRPATSAEIGFAHGISTTAILQALADNAHGFHHVIDPFQSRFGNAGLAMVEKAGLGGRMRFYEKFPEEVLPQMPLLDFVFIDASHLFDLTILDFALADKRLAAGGLAGFHDTWMPAIRKVIRFILSNRAYSVPRDLNMPSGGPVTARKLRSMAARIVRRVPASSRIFTGEVLRPWSDFGLGNLVVLRKNKDDDRDWRFYAPF